MSNPIFFVLVTKYSQLFPYHIWDPQLVDTGLVHPNETQSRIRGWKVALLPGLTLYDTVNELENIYSRKNLITADNSCFDCRRRQYKWGSIERAHTIRGALYFWDI